ncbi:hypothetical protein Btru_017131 [Bulinus truncatus]|nr:hypothetical protein Btru_017131 [Bulinus truncatus]
MEKYSFTQPDSNSFTESSVDFLISNSDEEDIDSFPSWDLISGLPALNSLKVPNFGKVHKITDMSSKQNDNPFLSTSEVDSDEAVFPLVSDTVSDNSSTFSNAENNNNITVVERIQSSAAKKEVHKASTSADSNLQPASNFSDSLPTKTVPDSPVMDICEIDSDESESDIFMIDKCCKDNKSSSYGKTNSDLLNKASAFAESQSFHLKLTPSLTEECETQDASARQSPTSSAACTIVPLTSPLKLKAESLPQESNKVNEMPSFVLQKPTVLDEEADILEDSESSISVFKKVRRGSTSPRKKRNFGDDSVEFLSTKTLQSKITAVQTRSETKLSTRSGSTVKSTSPYFIQSKKKSAAEKKNPAATNITVDTKNLKVSKEKDSTLGKKSKTLTFNISEKTKSSSKVKKEISLKSERKTVNVSDMNLVLSDSESSVIALTESYDYPTSDFAQTVDYRFQEGDSQQDIQAGSVKENKSSSSDISINPSQKRLPVSEKPIVIHSEDEFPGLNFSDEKDISGKCAKTDAADILLPGSLLNDGKPSNYRTSAEDQINSADQSARQDKAARHTYDQSTPSSSRTAASKYDSDHVKRDLAKTSDVYLFKDSQPPAQFVAPSVLKRRPVRLMKKMLHKRANMRSEDDQAESSTDECVKQTKKKRLALKEKGGVKDSIMKNVGDEFSADDRIETTSGLTNFTTVRKKSEVNKLHNIAAVANVTSSLVHSEQEESAQQLSKGKTNSTTAVQLNQSRATSNFSDSLGSESSSAHTSCPSNGGVLEIKRLIRTVTLHVIVTEKVITEILNHQKKIVNRHETNPSVVNKKDIGVIDESERVTKRIIKSEMSPSSVKSGEMADVSSLSKSSSSGTNNPSFDHIPASQNLQSSIQKQSSLGKQLTPHEISGEHDKDIHKTNSSGTDLLSTPNVTLIDHVDSQIGRTVVSANSSPSLPHASPVAIISSDGKDKSITSSLVPDNSLQQKSDAVPADDTQAEVVVDKNVLTRQRHSSKKEKALDLKPSQQRGVKRKVPSDSETPDNPLPVKSTQGDLQSTGFSIHVDSGRSSEVSRKSDPSTKSSSDISPQISLQGGLAVNKSMTLILSNYASKPEIGAKVMAKWNDGFYYAGILTKVDKINQKYMIKFEDGTQRWSKATEIILAAELPVGQSVLVLGTCGFYESGMIRGHSEATSTTSNQSQVMYHVERDDGITQICERGKLMLSEDQAACLLSDEEMRITPQSVTPDNIVDGKRQPKLNKSLSAMKEKRTSVPSPSTSASGLDCEDEKGQSSKKKKIGPVSTSTPYTKRVLRAGYDKTPEKQSSAVNIGGAVISPVDGRRSNRKARKGLFEDSKKLSKIFEGMKFVLTHYEKTAQHRSEEKRLLQDSSLDTSTDENTDLESDVPLFVKEQIESLITQGGGAVLTSFEDVSMSSNEKLFLIASEHQRTFKYLQALAAGVPVVSHQWVLHSVEKNSLQPLKAYNLPAGISLEKRKIIEETKGCIGLEKLTTLVVSTNTEFTKSWTSILKCARCNIISKLPASANKYDPGVDVVVADSTCPVSVVNKCHRLNIPLVSSEWIVQCLINGEVVDCKGHVKYQHDYQQA